MEPEGSLPCSQQRATDPVLCQMNSVHILAPYFLKIYLNIIVKWSLPFRFSGHNFVDICHLPCVLHVPPITPTVI